MVTVMAIEDFLGGPHNPYTFYPDSVLPTITSLSEAQIDFIENHEDSTKPLSTISTAFQNKFRKTGYDPSSWALLLSHKILDLQNEHESDEEDTQEEKLWRYVQDWVLLELMAEARILVEVARGLNARTGDDEGQFAEYVPSRSLGEVKVRVDKVLEARSSYRGEAELAGL